MPAIVAVESASEVSSSATGRPAVFQPYATGVIIRADGLILSQAHVSHILPKKPSERPRSRQPGERTTVVLNDGRRIKAELLGADLSFDLSLLRLLEAGPYPHLSLDPDASVGLGDWVLKLGHPLGYRRDRPSVVRLGRVLFQSRNIFVTDCLITRGDSDGPFVDLEGRLVGILGVMDVPGNLKDSLDRPLLGRLDSPGLIGPWSSTTSRFIEGHLGRMLRGEIAQYDQTANERFYESYRRTVEDDFLPREHWTQGRAIARAFQDVIRDSRCVVVSILDEADRHVSCGTIVEANGLIVTMASTLPAEPRCRLADGRVVTAQVIGMDPAFDLALLSVPLTGLPMVKWAEKPPPVTGTILAAVGMSESPPAIGIVSVPQRHLSGPFPRRVTRPALLAESPGVLGKPMTEGYAVDGLDDMATEAGVQVGDVILSIAGKKVHNYQDIYKSVDGRVATERVPVLLMRAGLRKELTLELRAVPLTESKPYADFPTLFEHDAPLLFSQCGGPLVDLDGDAVGITIYRGQYGCMAIPGDCVKRLLPMLKSEGLADKWTKPAPAASEKHKPSRGHESRKSTNSGRDK
jgi:serine protease Do